MNVLAEKARLGILNASEQAEIDDYCEAGHLLTLLQSKARIALEDTRSIASDTWTSRCDIWWQRANVARLSLLTGTGSPWLAFDSTAERADGPGLRNRRPVDS